MIGTIGSGRFRRRADNEVATDQCVGLLVANAHLVQIRRRPADADVTQHGTEFLREAHEVEHARPFALEVRRHRNQCADRHDAGTADPCYQQVIGPVDLRHVGLGQTGIQFGGQIDACCRLFLRLLCAFNGNETGAKTVQTGEILVAHILVDLPFSAEGGFLRNNGQAVRFHRTITAAFTYQVVDKNHAIGLGQHAALAPPPFFGGAGLHVNQYRNAGDFPKFPLYQVEIAAMRYRGAGWIVGGIELFRFIGNQCDALGAFGTYRMRDACHRYRPIDGLTAGHRDRVIE